ncbi:MAG: DEAD/DEAH box helicase [Treponema sp.]|jgi:rubrerythrin|nr:DEAD/DEAH box helicase [Treponema sp.]
MNNPIEIGRELKKSYLQYIKAGIPLMEKYYEDERNKMYEENGVIMQPPYIEIVKKYEGEKTLSKIFNENKIDIRIADFINCGLLYSDNNEERKLYKHQETAIIDVIKNKKNMVITTGTGSGKTEAFIIPLLANIIEESFKWKEQGKKNAALRSIIFYPLNALAEDQMIRLRKSLERQEVKEWYRKNELTKFITFGRYISRTPKNKYDIKFNDIKFRWDSVKRIIDNCKDKKQLNKLKELIFSSPCCDINSVEMIDRKSMQNTPPDILITNYSMLNIMLMRNEEQSLFEKTREWLSMDKKNLFTLVIDELHTYRGTAGTEVAYIIKVLLHRLGLSPDSPQVRFLASSASMDSSPDSREYISTFFDIDFNSFSLISDKQIEVINQKLLPPFPIKEIRDISNICINNSCETAINKYFNNIDDNIIKFVKKNKLIDWLTYSLQNNRSGNIYAKSINEISNILFDAYESKDRQLFTEIFILLINMSKGDDGFSLQPLRAHYFLRNIEKIYMCVNKDCNMVDSEYKFENRQYGKMYNTPITRCSCGSLVYEAIVCRHCGEMYFCGYINNEKLINVPDNFIPSKPIVLYKPEKELYPDGKIDNWITVDFDYKTGKIKNDRYGEYYKYKKNEDSDFPTTCPRCEFSTTRLRTSDFSALFRHGTGVQKVNQVCADKIMQVLSGENEARKLVIFSDSRQSAAKLSAGIELDHYRDVLRQTILTSFNSNSELIEHLIRWRKGDIKDYNDIPENKRRSIKDNVYLNKIRVDIRDEKEGQLSPCEKAILDNKLTGISPSLENIMSTIMKKLENSGINPAGPYPNNNYIDPMNRNIRWYKCIDFNDNSFIANDPLTRQFVREMQNSCKLEILRVMLGTPKRSFESLGLGYYHVQTSVNSVSPEFLDSILRIIGECNRIYTNMTEEQRSFPRRLWNYIRVVKNETTRNHPLLDLIKQEFVVRNILKDNIDLRITGNTIVFIPAKEGDNVWICPICNTKHLHHSDGICTYCFSNLQPKPEKLRMEETYYTQERDINKLHCEELTGQTNTKDALDRQRLFQDIFYENENEKIDNIEILSVTTTMEAGVDIGQLSAVMMGNVPPQRFNYQQRVGRAGRRGNPLSIALTVSRASSHDQMHYANPERIVSGDPLPPYLDFSSKDIFKRIVYKELLRNAFVNCGISTNKSDSVHGQFGYVYDWVKNKLVISDWLKKQTSIPENYSYLINKFDNEKIKGEKKEILKNISKEIISNIDETLSDPNFNQMYLSERLAAGGRLPMFGFPTQVKNLYESWPKGLPADDITDRHMDLALATFSPGSEIVKDKKIYTSVGFIDFTRKNGRIESIDGLNKYENKILYQCPECWYTAVLDNTNFSKCPICGHTFEEDKGEICSDICSPKGYCVNFSEQPKDFDGNFNWNPIKISSRLDSEVTREIELKSIEKTNIKMGNNIIPDKGVVRTINTNNGELFHITKTSNNGWVNPDLVNFRIPPNAEEKQIALVTSKITGIVILAIAGENENICINPLFVGKINNINKIRPQLIKSAFLSWGELVRRSVSDYLDIRNSELSVDYSIRRDNEIQQAYPSIYMMEQLENGAGYTDHLASLQAKKKYNVFIEPLLKNGNIFEILTNNHQNYCDTSCYDCLCDYYNQQKHALLNWRLGLDVAMLSYNNNYLPSYTEENSYWHSILEKTEKIINNNNNFPETKLNKGDKFWYTSSEDKINFIYHPLWSEKYIQDTSKELLLLTNKSINYISLLEYINNPL